MFSEVFKEVIKDNGVVSFTSWSNGNVHVANTWNNYIKISGENAILIPAAWFNRTEKNVKENNDVIITLGSPNIQGKVGMGTGFVIRGKAYFLSEGEEFEMMKSEFAFATRVIKVVVNSINQTI